MANHYYRQSRSRSRTRKYPRRSTTWLWVLFGMLIGVGGSTLGYMFLTDQKLSRARLSEKKPSVQKMVKKEKDSAQRFEFYTLLPGMEIQLPDANSSNIEKISQPEPQPQVQTQKPATESIQVVVQAQASPLPPPAPTITHTPAPKPPKLPTKSTTTKRLAQTTQPARTPSRIPQTHTSAFPKPVTRPSINTIAARYIIQAGIFQELRHADALKARLTLQGFNTKIQKIQTQEGYTWFRVTLGPFTSEAAALNQKKRLQGQKIQSILILQRPNS